MYLKHFCTASRIIVFKPLSDLEHIGIYYQHGIKEMGVNVLKTSVISRETILNKFDKSKNVKKLYNPSIFRSGLLLAHTNTIDYSKYIFLGCNLQDGVTQLKRSFSTSNKPSAAVKRKKLMNVPFRMGPSVFQRIKNLIFVYFIVKPFYEPEFTLGAFMKASEQALVTVSEILSRGDFNSLKDYIEDEALVEIESNFSSLSLKERLDLNTKLNDILFSDPNEVRIISKKDDKESTERVFLEITMCYCLVKGFHDYIEKVQTSGNYERFDDPEERLSMANYRFIKEITKGSEDQWTINCLNHFKPVRRKPRF